MSAAPDLWVKIVKYFKLDIYHFIEDFHDEFVNIAIENYQVSPVSLTTV